jgi:hypothetical protein
MAISLVITFTIMFLLLCDVKGAVVTMAEAEEDCIPLDVQIALGSQTTRTDQSIKYYYSTIMPQLKMQTLRPRPLQAELPSYEQYCYIPQ